MADTEEGPTCSRPMKYIGDWPSESSTEGGNIRVSLASSVYECPEHGLWRV